MAVDTAEKRRMIIDFGKIRGTGMPIPKGMISLTSRIHVLNLYFEALVPGAIIFWRNKNRVTGLWQSKSAPSSTWKGKTSPTTSWKGKTTPSDSGTQTI